MTDSPTIATVTSGDGPTTLLFVHGWLNDLSVWDAVTEHLADRFRCIAVDLRGHGNSEATGDGNYGRDLVLDDLRRVLAEHRCEQAVIVGHSLGGYLALALAIESPELVSGLGLVAAGPGFRNPDSRDQWNDSVRATAAKSDIPAGQEQISMHVDAMVIDRLSEISAPVSVIVGERDKRFLVSADVFAKYLDVKQRCIVADAGHMVHLKKPDEVAEALAATFG